MADRDHLIPLPGSEWSLWRCACLRGAGFPASRALALADVDAAAAADELIDAEAALLAARDRTVAALRVDGAEASVVSRVRRARKRVERSKLPDPADVEGMAGPEIEALALAITRVESARAAAGAAFEESQARASRTLRDLAEDSRFREAVTWQNAPVVKTAFDGLTRTDEGDKNPRSKERQRQELIASYLFRYATKNDTIGFFGPVGWVRFDESEERMVVRPGPTLLARRETYFEQWGIDVLATHLSQREDVLPWVAPHRYGFVRLDGSVAHNPLTGKQQLSRAQELVLRACDGRATANELATQLTSAHPGELADAGAVRDVLKELVAKKLVAWSLEFRTTWRPENELRARLERIGDAGVREECLAALGELEAARARIATSAGDATKLAAAIAELDAAFERITAKPATRNAGLTYASRALVFEDCRRDLDCMVGSKLLGEIGPALALVLASARYVTFEAGKAYEAKFRELYAGMAQRSGSAAVPFSDFWFRVQRFFHGTKDRPVDVVAEAAREKWASILKVSPDQRRLEYRSEELAQLVADAFPAPHAGWSTAREHSPDLMIGADGPEALARGDYFAVLGEIHVARNTLDSQVFSAQHPDIDELSTAVGRDIPGPRVFILPSKDSPRSATVRGTRAMRTPNDYELEAGFDTSALPPPYALRLGDLLLEDVDGRLVVRTADDAVRIDLLELVGSTTLGDVVVNALELEPKMAHSPRVTIDRLVILRETWRCTPAELTFAAASTDAERFLGARRWARANGMPRFVFVRSSLEVKPMYVDFASPVAVSLLAKVVRRAQEHVSGGATLKLCEMLPTLEDSWLPDADGHRYTSEIRVVAVDASREGGT